MPNEKSSFFPVNDEILEWILVFVPADLTGEQSSRRRLVALAMLSAAWEYGRDTPDGREVAIGRVRHRADAWGYGDEVDGLIEDGINSRELYPGIGSVYIVRYSEFMPEDGWDGA